MLMALQLCYVFKPDEAVEQGHRPSKRRKTAQLHNLNAQDEVLPLAPLLRGTELPATVKFRYEIFNTIWSSKEDSVNVTRLPDLICKTAVLTSKRVLSMQPMCLLPEMFHHSSAAVILSSQLKSILLQCVC